MIQNGLTSKKQKKISIEAENWSKAWPQNKKDLSFEDFNKNFSWFDAWSEKHFFYIIKIILPFLGLLILISIISSARFKKIDLNNNIIFIPLIVMFLGSIIFLKISFV